MVLLKVSEVFHMWTKMWITKQKYYSWQFVPASLLHFKTQKLQIVTMKGKIEVTCVLFLRHYEHCATIIYFWIYYLNVRICSTTSMAETILEMRSNFFYYDVALKMNRCSWIYVW